nr:putative amino-acid metabolite efflux pump [Candidatus Pantoea persica]
MIATLGMFMLATAGMEGQSATGITLTTMMLTLAAALSWGISNITNKIILRNRKVPVVGLLSAALVLDEHLTAQQMLGASVIIVRLMVNVFGGLVSQHLTMRPNP